MYDLKITNAKIVDGTGLKAFHSDIGVIDGFPGTKTMKSILQYQRDNNLLETGRINDELIESLHISVDDKIS